MSVSLPPDALYRIDGVDPETGRPYGRSPSVGTVEGLEWLGRAVAAKGFDIPGWGAWFEKELAEARLREAPPLP